MKLGRSAAALMAACLGLLLLATPAQAHSTWVPIDSENSDLLQVPSLVGLPVGTPQHIGTYPYFDQYSTEFWLAIYVDGITLEEQGVQNHFEGSYLDCSFNGSIIEKVPTSLGNAQYSGSQYDIRAHLPADHWFEDIVVYCHDSTDLMSHSIVWQASQVHNSLTLAKVVWTGLAHAPQVVEIGGLEYPRINDLLAFQAIYAQDLDRLENMTDQEQVRANTYAWAQVILEANQQHFTWLGDRLSSLGEQPYDDLAASYYERAYDTSLETIDGCQALLDGAQYFTGTLDQLKAQARELWATYQAAAYYSLASIYEQAQYEHPGEIGAEQRALLVESAQQAAATADGLLGLNQPQGGGLGTVGEVLASMTVSGAFLVIGGVLLLIGLFIRRGLVILLSVALLAVSIYAWVG